MNEFISYEKKLGRLCDFIVEYDFIENQQDYQVTLSQGMRSDFCYEDDFDSGMIHMIWPEFEDEIGELIKYTDTPILNHGRARMWIMEEEQRSKHKERLELGQVVFFVAGSHKIAKATVVEIVGLNSL